jgi:hypothetical protein
MYGGLGMKNALPFGDPAQRRPVLTDVKYFSRPATIIFPV